MQKLVLFDKRATLEQYRTYSIIAYKCRVLSPVLPCYSRIANSHIFIESFLLVHVLMPQLSKAGDQETCCTSDFWIHF